MGAGEISSEGVKNNKINGQVAGVVFDRLLEGMVVITTSKFNPDADILLLLVFWQFGFGIILIRNVH